MGAAAAREVTGSVRRFWLIYQTLTTGDDRSRCSPLLSFPFTLPLHMAALSV